MHFIVQDQRYIVAIASRPLMLDGQSCRAKLDRRVRRIWLSDQLAKTERRLALFHELRHVWSDAHGRPGSDEADADDAAAMLDDLMSQYLEQGGDATLEALEPAPDTLPARQVGSSLALIEAECGHCHARIAPGSIAAAKPEWSAELSIWTVDRGFLCCVCDQVTTWRETCTPAGSPLGSILPHPPPRVLNGKEAGEWINAHQRTCGIVSV